MSVEEVDEVWVYCSTAEFRRHKSGLVQLAEWVAAADQEAVAILIDGGMEIVVEENT